MSAEDEHIVGFWVELTIALQQRLSAPFLGSVERYRRAVLAQILIVESESLRHEVVPRLSVGPLVVLDVRVAYHSKLACMHRRLCVSSRRRPHQQHKSEKNIIEY